MGYITVAYKVVGVHTCDVWYTASISVEKIPGRVYRTRVGVIHPISLIHPLITGCCNYRYHQSRTILIHVECLFYDVYL